MSLLSLRNFLQEELAAFMDTIGDDFKDFNFPKTTAVAPGARPVRGGGPGL